MKWPKFWGKKTKDEIAKSEYEAKLAKVEIEKERKAISALMERTLKGPVGD